MRCTVCYKPLTVNTLQWAVLPGQVEESLVCKDDRQCEVRQVNYNPIPRIKAHAQRFVAIGGQL